MQKGPGNHLRGFPGPSMDLILLFCILSRDLADQL